MRKSIGRIAAATYAMLAVGTAQIATAAHINKNNSTQETKQSLAPTKPVVITESKRNSHGQQSYKHKKVGFLDQRHKRKKLRSNPSFARSKKCTTKTR